MLSFEHGSVWCWSLDAPGNRSETPGKFWNVVLQKDGEDQLDRSCENEEVLLRVNEQRKILHEIRKRKANWIGHILRRNCLLQQVIEGKIMGQIEVTRRQGRRRKKLLDDLKDRRGYCQLKEEALDRTMWRNRFGRGFGPIVWEITDDDISKTFPFHLAFHMREQERVSWHKVGWIGRMRDNCHVVFCQKLLHTQGCVSSSGIVVVKEPITAAPRLVVFSIHNRVIFSTLSNKIVDSQFVQEEQIPCSQLH